MEYARLCIRGINKLSNRLRRKFDAFSSAAICSGAEGRTLHFLIANSDADIYQKDVEEEFGIRPSTATVLLQKMEADGLIRREISDQDARLKKIILTDKAMAFIGRVRNDLDTLESQFVEGISEEDLQVFLRVLRKMSSNI